MVNASILVRSDKAIPELGYEVVPIETVFMSCIDWMTAENLISRAEPRCGPTPPLRIAKRGAAKFRSHGLTADPRTRRSGGLPRTIDWSATF
jgi:hypothetical protein